MSKAACTAISSGVGCHDPLAEWKAQRRVTSQRHRGVLDVQRDGRRKDAGIQNPEVVDVMDLEIPVHHSSSRVPVDHVAALEVGALDLGGGGRTDAPIVGLVPFPVAMNIAT